MAILKPDNKRALTVKQIFQEGAPFAASLLIEHIRAAKKGRKKLSESRFRACVYVIDQCIGRPAVQATIQHTGQVTYKQLVEQSGASILAEAQSILADAGSNAQPLDAEDTAGDEARPAAEPVILLAPPKAIEGEKT